MANQPQPQHVPPTVPPDSPATMLGAEFRAVHRAEPLTAALQPADSEAEIRAAAFALGATALCLSGGGIRSASFCLGVVQGLAKRNLLSKFDYLSTVSGGGYLGSMLAAWMYRSPDGCAAVERALSAGGRSDGDALDTLRRQLRYLAPRQGFFSVDTWTLISTYVRNFTLNALVWLPAIALVLTIPWSVAALIDLAATVLQGQPVLHWLAEIYIAFSFAAILYATFELRRAIARDRALAPPAVAPLIYPLVPIAPPTNRRIQEALFGGVLILSAATYWLAYADPVAFWKALAEDQPGSWIPALHVPSGTPAPILLGLVFAILHAYLGWNYRSPLIIDQSFRAAASLAGFVSGFVTGALVGWIMTALVHSGAWELSLASYVTLVPPALLAAIGVGEILFIGAISRFATDFDREWWSRAGAWSSIFCIGWLALCTLAFFGPVAVHWVSQRRLGVSAYWATVALAGVIARVLLRQETPVARDERPQRRIAEWAIDMAATLALAAILVGIAWLLTRALGGMSALLDTFGLRLPSSNLPFALSDVLALAIGLGLIVSVAGWCVDVNRFSLHAMYRERLIRTFLGATRARYAPPSYAVDDTARYTESNQFAPRNPDRFIEFDRDDNPIFRWLAPGRGAALAPRKGPFLIVNAALNLVAGHNLAWQERKAASFTFTSLSVGSPLLGYRSSADYGSDYGGITLGTAMAVSGAAVSPNAGMLSSPVRTFLLTLCNARLGWWLGHPRDLACVRSGGPGFALRALVSELLGRTDDRHPWLFVSDGGHFENLGLYEAVRRGCRDIVLVDGSCDPDRNFDDLGNAIRKIRIDLGVSIERAGPLRVGGRELQADGRYCALFDVTYDDAHSGSLLYIKSALYPKAENMPIDVLQYAGRSATFPHESTARQFFTESQFESYRALGEFEVDAIVEGTEMANRPDRTVPETVAEFIEIASIRMTE